MEKKELFNVFSYRLAKNESSVKPALWRVTDSSYYSEPVYTDGDFNIFRKSDNHFLHCYKNIIFAERCGLNTQLLTDIKNDSFSGCGDKFHNFDSPKEALANGIEFVKFYPELNF